MNDLHREFKNLKRISPDKDYGRRSLLVIVSTPQIKRVFWPYAFLMNHPALTPSALVLAAFILFSAIAMKQEVPLKIAGLDPQGLKAEAEELELHIKDAELHTIPTMTQAIALEEAASSNPGELNSEQLKREQRGIDAELFGNTAIDAALQSLSQ